MSYEEINISIGDVNLDGIINILDILMVVNYILSTIDFNEAEYQAADYNGDNAINMLDIVMIINLILSVP